LGRNKKEFETKLKAYRFPLYLCEMLENEHNQTKFVIECLEMGFGMKNPKREHLLKKKKALEIELNSVNGALATLEVINEKEAAKKELEQNTKLKWYKNLVTNFKVSSTGSGIINVQFGNTKQRWGFNCSEKEFLTFRSEWENDGFTFERFEEILKMIEEEKKKSR